MKIKTLLLGTATAFVMVGGAQAADLAVAEPVDYVKVCDAYGAGYFYIPGTDTCLKIGGYVKLTVDFYDDSRNTNVGNAFFIDPTDAVEGSTALIPATLNSDHPSNWDMQTEVGLRVTAQSMTDIGLLTGYIEYRANTNNSNAFSNSGLLGKNVAYLDSAYLKAGPLKMGNFTNIYMYGGDFTEVGINDLDAADFNNDQIAFNTSFGGVGFWLGVADNRDNPGGSAFYEGDWPDIVAALTGTAGGFDWKWSIAATDTVFGTGWATQFGATYTFAGGDAIRAKAAVGNSEGMPYINSLPTRPNDGTWWSAFVAGIHYWSSNVGTELVAEYTTGDSGSIWQVGTETNWVVAKGFLTGIAVKYTDSDFASSSALQVSLVGKRSF